MKANDFLLRVLAAQALGLCGMLLVGMLEGVEGLVTAFLAGVACLLPAVLFVLLLVFLHRFANPLIISMVLLVGNVVKMLLSALLLFLFAWSYSQMVWWVFLLTVVVVLKSSWIVLLRLNKS